MARLSSRLRQLILLLLTGFLLMHGDVWLWWLGTLVAPLVWPGRWRWRAAAILLTPLALVLGGFASGVLRYAVGTGAIEGMGLPGAEYWNLDRTTRAPKWNGGCLVLGTEFLTLVPNNAGMHFMGSLFGRMPSAYDGPYPDPTQAAALLATPTDYVDADGFRRGRLRLSSGGDVFVSPDLERELYPRGPLCHGDWNGAQADFPAVLVDGRLVVFVEQCGNASATHLVDLRTKQVIANYFTGGEPP
jgi:hypothetical protein